MKALKSPVKKNYGMCYNPYFTEEFEKIIESAREKISPFSEKEISGYTYYFKVKDEEVSSEYDCCDNDKCVKQSKIDIRRDYGKGTHVEECYYSNDGDHESIDYCCQCGKPLNEWLTWCEDELNYIEEEKAWTPEFIKKQAFTIHCILQSCPTLDYEISDYAKCHSEELKKELERREQFFQIVGELAKYINENTGEATIIKVDGKELKDIENIKCDPEE